MAFEFQKFSKMKKNSTNKIVQMLKILARMKKHSKIKLFV